MGETVTITWTESAGNEWYWINVYKDGELTVNQSMGKAQSYTMTNAEAGSYVIWLSANNSAGQKGHGECAFTVGEVSGVKINSANFPDDIARGLILENLDKDHNTYLSDAEIAAVTELDINDLGISDLKGIEYFTELTHLDCAGNQLTELDLSHNTKLVSLLVGYLHDGSSESVTHSGEAHGNQLTTLDLSQNHALEYVMCAENRLTSLNLSGCTSLKAIWCYDNQLTALDLSDCASLTGLYCSNNRISTLNLSGHTALEALVCWDNSLATLFVSGCSALSYISCGGNQLTALDLSSCAALEELYVSYEIQDDNGNYQTHGNRLTALDLSHNPALKEVQCYGNQLSSLNVSGCSKLEGLYCSNNQLTGLNLSGCAALNELYCFGNRLSELNLSGCRNLHALQCFGNTQLATLNVSSAPALLELMNAVEPTVYSDAIVYQSEDALLSYDPATQLLTTGGLSIYALTNNQSILVKFDTVKSGCGNTSNYVITNSSGQIVPLSYAGDAQGETGVANTYKLNFPDPLPADTPVDLPHRRQPECDRPAQRADHRVHDGGELRVPHAGRRGDSDHVGGERVRGDRGRSAERVPADDGEDAAAGDDVCGGDAGHVVERGAVPGHDRLLHDGRSAGERRPVNLRFDQQPEHPGALRQRGERRREQVELCRHEQLRADRAAELRGERAG